MIVDGRQGSTLTSAQHDGQPCRGHEHGGHAHEHDGHTHAHGAEGRRTHGIVVAEGAPRGGPVVLDIGGDVGAVIALLDDELEGTELPIHSLDDPERDPGAHTGVWRRALLGHSVVVAVYPQLTAGRYRIVVPAGPTTEFDVVGGRVTDLDLTTRYR